MRNLGYKEFLFLFFCGIAAFYGYVRGMEEQLEAEEQESKFIPTKEACGASAGKKNVPDDIHSRITCMVAGFKGVYLGSTMTILYDHIK